MKRVRKDDEASQREGHFENYADYSRNLRAWLVAYGIGGPVLFLTNDALALRVGESGHADEIVISFLAGVGLQILLALINKWAAWHMYAGVGDADYQGSWRYRFWDLINDQSWIDVSVDVLSIAAFIWATWRVLNVFLA